MSVEKKQLTDLICKMIDVPTKDIDADLYKIMTQVPWHLERALVMSVKKCCPDFIANIERKHPKEAFKDETGNEYAQYDCFHAINWRLNDSSPLSMMLRDIIKSQPTLNSQLKLNDFITVSEVALELQGYYYFYPCLLKRNSDGSDVHFAERKFLENVFYPAFGKEGLEFIRPQVEFQGSSGKKRYIDFVLYGLNKYAIEIEGASYHDPQRIEPDKHADDTARQRSLTSAGYQVYRYTAKDIIERPEKLITEIRQWVLSDPMLEAKIGTPIQYDAPSERDQQMLEWALLALYFIPKYFRRLQLALFHTLIQSREQIQQESVVLFDEEPIGILVPLALDELLNLMHHAETLYGINLDLPTKYRVILNTSHQKDMELTWMDSVWKEYRWALGQIPDEKGRYSVDYEWYCKSFALDAPIHVNLRRTIEKSEQLTLLEPSPLISLDASCLMQDQQRKFIDELCVSQNRLRPKQWNKRMLDYFARRFFSIPSIYDWQWTLMTKIVHSESTFGIMPTGSGKSLCYQLLAMIIPGGMLVISPLRSLMRDQIANLRGCGINAANYVMSTVPTAQKEQRLEDFFMGKIQLLYISPERVRIKSFLEEMCKRAKHLNIFCVTIDEAHCVSEWGHDFRLSYMQIPLFVESLATEEWRPPILALTATASPPVEKDVLTVLNLREESLEKSPSLIRPELSLSAQLIHPYADKQESLRDVLQQTVPNVLKRNIDELLRKQDENAGVVFCIYANSHGKTTYLDSVGAVRDYLIRENIIPEELCRLHSSEVPEQCPECDSYTFRRLPKSESSQREKTEYKCIRCGHHFMKPLGKRESNWDKEVEATQDDFKRNEFPLIVATKGYGMGIDKRNIRFIVHHGFSASIESYYQEAGRAGRDGEHSHCVILYRPPHPDCESYYLGRRKNAEAINYPLCMEGRNWTYWTCPYMSELCDYAKQLRFLRSNYPGVEREVSRIMNIWNQQDKVTGQIKLSYRHTKHSNRTNELKERALYRLQMLGLVREYFIDYSMGIKKAEIIAAVNPLPTLSELVQNLALQLHKVYQVDLKIRWERLTTIQRIEREIAEQFQGFSASMQLPVTDEHIQCALELLVKVINRYVQGMRMDTLELLHYYTRDKKCRWEVLLGHLKTGEVIKQCEFCDNCKPDLNFAPRKRAKTDFVEFEDIVHDFALLTSDFDMNGIDELLEATRNRNVEVTVTSMAQNTLQYDPFNLAGLMVAGKLQSEREDEIERSQGFRYLARGFTVADENYRDFEIATKFYEEAKVTDSDAAVELLDKEGGIFDTPKGHKRIFQEFRQIKPDDERTEMIGQIACYSELAKVADEICSDENMRLLEELITD